MHRSPWLRSSVVVLLIAGCPGDPGTTNGTSSGETAGGTADPPTTTTMATTEAPGSSSGADPTGDTSDTDSTGGTPVPVPPACDDESKQACDDPIMDCKEDQDHDWINFACDNAPKFPNPEQTDIDDDGFGDVIDLCPTVAAENNTADTDHDGVGNVCDACAKGLSSYNKGGDAVPFYMRVRNIPTQVDSDRDGIGDACDNCVRTPNCQGFGDANGLTPYVVGQPIDPDAIDCQPDLDVNQIGDACAGQMSPGAAGPIGFADDDDFDQDGLANIIDACPRQPVAEHACAGDQDCPDGASCAPAGRCNHSDRDGDGVGDICDTCQMVANPGQVIDGQAQLDDIDGDFIGQGCEQDDACFERPNPGALGFYDISVDGKCCVTTYQGQPLIDPDGNPIDVAGLAPRPPGVFELPPGCAQALEHSEDGKAHKMKLCHVDLPSDLWPYLCFLPANDQEFDGVPDLCDLCPHAWDPGQEIYVDQNMMEYPNVGKYCRGEYDPGNWDPANMCMPP